MRKKKRIKQVFLIFCVIILALCLALLPKHNCRDMSHFVEQELTNYRNKEVIFEIDKENWHIGLMKGYLDEENEMINHIPMHVVISVCEDNGRVKMYEYMNFFMLSDEYVVCQVVKGK